MVNSLNETLLQRNLAQILNLQKNVFLLLRAPALAHRCLNRLQALILNWNLHQNFIMNPTKISNDTEKNNNRKILKL